MNGKLVIVKTYLKNKIMVFSGYLSFVLFKYNKITFLPGNMSDFCSKMGFQWSNIFFFCGKYRFWWKASRCPSILRKLLTRWKQC